MSHTPGPWRIDTKESLPDWEIVVDARCHIVANVNTESGPDIPPAVSIKMPAKANAYLIASAPDMLAMLEELRECAYCWCDYEVPVGIVERLDETIKKARGNE